MAIISAGLFRFGATAQAQNAAPVFCASFASSNRLVDLATSVRAMTVEERSTFLSEHVHIEPGSRVGSSTIALTPFIESFEHSFGAGELRSAVGFVLSSLARPRGEDTLWFRTAEDPVERLPPGRRETNKPGDEYSIRVTGANGFPFKLPLFKWTDTEPAGDYEVWLYGIILRLERLGGDVIVHDVKPVFGQRRFGFAQLEVFPKSVAHKP